jgi:hypothetical protein
MLPPWVMVEASSHVPLYSLVESTHRVYGYFLFLQEQKKDIIIIMRRPSLRFSLTRTDLGEYVVDLPFQWMLLLLLL